MSVNLHLVRVNSDNEWCMGCQGAKEVGDHWDSVGITPTGFNVAIGHRNKARGQSFLEEPLNRMDGWVAGGLDTERMA